MRSFPHVRLQANRSLKLKEGVDIPHKNYLESMLSIHPKKIEDKNSLAFQETENAESDIDHKYVSFPS